MKLLGFLLKETVKKKKKRIKKEKENRKEIVLTSVR